MNYKLGQLVKDSFNVTYTNNSSFSDDPYIDYIKEGTVKTMPALNTTFAGATFSFEDQCIKLNSALSNTESYYFKSGVVKKLNDDQTIYVYLTKYNENGAPSMDSLQYIKKIYIPAGTNNDTEVFEYFDFVFTPVLNNTFDCILFQLERKATEYSYGTARSSDIYYIEFGKIKNQIKDRQLIKAGVKGVEGSCFCINNEEIHVGKTGVYELKNGLITMTFLAPVSGSNLLYKIDYSYTSLDNFYKASSDNQKSLCLFNVGKETVVNYLSLCRNKTYNHFIVDYIEKN